jgi:hypothetical protein
MAYRFIDNEMVNCIRLLNALLLCMYPKYNIWYPISCILFLINCYIQAKIERYVPPHVRGKTMDEDSKKQEQMKRLRRQMKGLLNRLAENNMNSIALQVEHLYVLILHAANHRHVM